MENCEEWGRKRKNIESNRAQFKLLAGAWIMQRCEDIGDTGKILFICYYLTNKWTIARRKKEKEERWR